MSYRVPESDHVVTTFQRTPPIMTYVLSFLISDYEMIENNDTSVVHHIYAAPAKLKDMGFALEASVKILGIIEEYLNVPYGQPKYDQIGLPNFAPEATENYGEWIVSLCLRSLDKSKTTFQQWLNTTRTTWSTIHRSRGQHKNSP